MRGSRPGRSWTYQKEGETIMPKMKTHKGTKKRMKLTANGKVKHKTANAGHLMSGKSGNRCRSLRKPSILKGAIAKRIVRTLNNA